MKPVKTWIVIADGARARILVNEGVGKGLAVVEGADFHAAHPPSGDLTTDRPGRSFDIEGSGRHAMEERADPHREAKRTFLGALADYLDNRNAAGAFDRLVILAPPQALGDLRAALSDSVRAKVAAERAKDLTQVPNEDIPEHLEDILAV